MQYSVKEDQLLRNKINEIKWNKYAKCNIKLFDNISACTTKYCKEDFTFSLQQCKGSMYHNNLLKRYELLNRILGGVRRNLCSKYILQFQNCTHHLFNYILDLGRRGFSVQLGYLNKEKNQLFYNAVKIWGCEVSNLFLRAILHNLFLQ